MNREHWSKILPIIQAFAEGKTIQFHPNYSPSGDFTWKDLPPGSTASFDNTITYRIKPEQTWRPWKPHEVPVGALIRRKRRDVSEQEIGVLIIGALTDGFRTGTSLIESFVGALQACEWKWPDTDPQIATLWKPCGVLESTS